MGQALYRKYRSKSLAEIVGQEHITRTLQRAIESGRISHAYLFTGPRGVGKTSIARILAHELNGVPYTGEDSHLDIIEIDAASNGGVDEVRDLRDKVYIAPSSGTYKVYIIDEVHMMTTSAFNALLKTLEEPPAHAVFILATTEAHKLPATIVSRTQRFTFKPIPRPQVVAHLREIADAEKITISDDALDLIAEHGGGSFRDSISMLDQAGSSGEKVDRAFVERLLGVPPAGAASELLDRIAAHDLGGLAVLLGKLRGDGFQAAAIARQLGQALRAGLLEGTASLPRTATLALLTRLIDVPASHNPEQLLEIVLLEAALPAETTPAAVAVTQPPPSPARLPAAIVSEPTPAPASIPQPAARTAATPGEITETPAAADAPPADPAPTGDGQPITAAQWQQVLESLKKQYNTLYGIIRMARPEFLAGRVVLTFGFAFHQKRANDAKNKKLLTAVLEEVAGGPVAIECKYDKTATPPGPMIAMAPAAAPAAASAPPAAGAPLEAISNIFGGGELLES
ncbi:MAG TPA: DNA polymerase III subunit gamma/tau [Candidatus Saccharimonadales bacterium]|nr:DNA polymerase III subunit gamma/tau [Candidatus Saccharimonadales bacterium]